MWGLFLCPGWTVHRRRPGRPGVDALAQVRIIVGVEICALFQYETVHRRRPGRPGVDALAQPPIFMLKYFHEKNINSRE